MFEWLHSHHDSPELEHAKHRQEERDASSMPIPLKKLNILMKKAWSWKKSILKSSSA